MRSRVPDPILQGAKDVVGIRAQRHHVEQLWPERVRERTATITLSWRRLLGQNLVSRFVSFSQQYLKSKVCKHNLINLHPDHLGSFSIEFDLLGWHTGWLIGSRGGRQRQTIE